MAKIAPADMAPTAKTIVGQALAIKPGEKVCLLTDTGRSQVITGLLAEAARAAGAELVVVTMAPREVGGVDPPAPAAAALLAADVIIAQASSGILHTETVRKALRRGARICDMWGFTEDMMVEGGATADYTEIADLSRRLAEVLSAGSEARLTTRDGSHLTFSLKGRKARVLDAKATQPGQFCAFPDGEAAIAPFEGTADGVLVNPFSAEHAGLGFLKEPLTVKVEQGRAVSVEGGRAATVLRGILEDSGETARNIAELGLGTNRKCRLGVTIRETKKCWGTAHVALGDSKSIGGKVESPLHMDLIFREPTVTVDGRVVLRQGQLVV